MKHRVWGKETTRWGQPGGASGGHRGREDKGWQPNQRVVCLKRFTIRSRHRASRRGRDESSHETRETTHRTGRVIQRRHRGFLLLHPEQTFHGDWDGASRSWECPFAERTTRLKKRSSARQIGRKFFARQNTSQVSSYTSVEYSFS